jgi:hypothetical protein
MASAATDERSDAHEQRVAHCYPPVLPVTESLASLIALVILSRNSAKITTTNPAVMIVTITQPGTSPVVARLEGARTALRVASGDADAASLMEELQGRQGHR